MGLFSRFRSVIREVSFGLIFISVPRLMDGGMDSREWVSVSLILGAFMLSRTRPNVILLVR